MCLISYCGKGTEKYSDEVVSFIRAGFHTQRDGSGYMYKKSGDESVFLSKGYRNLERMFADIKSANLDLEDELAIHHRTSTSGREDAFNCHPFVVSQDHLDLTITEGKVKKPVLMHNGVFRNINTFEKMDTDFSDTYAFVRHILAVPQVLDLYKNNTEMFQFLLSDFVKNNKTLTFFHDRDVIMTGNFIEHNGYFHSNECFRNYSYRDKGGVGGEETGQSCSHSGTETNTAEPSLPILNLGSGYAVRPAIRLCGKDIRIDKENFDHFYYVKKADISNSRILVFENFVPFTYLGPLNVMYVMNNSFRLRGQCVSDNELHTTFWFYPKVLYAQAYIDYKTIITQFEKPGKRTLKKLVDLLRRKPIKNIDDKLFMEKAKRSFSKLALYEWYRYFRDDVLSDPTEKDLVLQIPGKEPAPWNENTDYAIETAVPAD